LFCIFGFCSWFLGYWFWLGIRLWELRISILVLGIIQLLFGFCLGVRVGFAGDAGFLIFNRLVDLRTALPFCRVCAAIAVNNRYRNRLPNLGNRLCR
jgi:ABC-type dipeptide/oligopeptide/nickel transport system permease subunit